MSRLLGCAGVGAAGWLAGALDAILLRVRDTARGPKRVPRPL
ncbi:MULTISPECIES: hypothetical protein [Isoptericola]|nr:MULTISPECIES: hypothetical protein [Isoptericola]